jgi:hypothetical protein
MTSHGHKNCAIDNFVKFGGGDAMHHNHTMLEECVFDVPPNSLRTQMWVLERNNKKRKELGHAP